MLTSALRSLFKKENIVPDTTTRETMNTANPSNDNSAVVDQAAVQANVSEQPITFDGNAITGVVVVANPLPTATDVVAVANAMMAPMVIDPSPVGAVKIEPSTAITPAHILSPLVAHPGQVDAVKIETSTAVTPAQTTETGAGKRSEKRSSTGEAGSSPTKRRRQSGVNPKKAVPRWNDMLFLLLQYRNEHGNCMVPLKSGGELGKWVATQRAQYLQLQKQKEGGEAIKTENQVPVNDENVDPVSGSTDAAGAYPSNDDLHSPTGTSTDANAEALNGERVEVLASLGFVWDIVQADNDARWKKRYDELVEYKAVHGHCNVPQSTELGKWVKMQRENKHETDLKKAGQTPQRKKPKPCLSDDRIKKLEAVGFQWRVAKPAVGWENRYNQLVEYKQQHGDCNVPQSFPQDKPFGRWVMKQRCQQSLKLRGEKSQLTDEREAKLNALGFSWVAPGFSKKTVTLPHDDDLDEDDYDGDEDQGDVAMADSQPPQEQAGAPVTIDQQQHLDPNQMPTIHYEVQPSIVHGATTSANSDVQQSVQPHDVQQSMQPIIVQQPTMHPYEVPQLMQPHEVQQHDVQQQQDVQQPLQQQHDVRQQVQPQPVHAQDQPMSVQIADAEQHIHHVTVPDVQSFTTSFNV